MRLSDTRFALIDTETAARDRDDDKAEICEAALHVISLDGTIHDRFASFAAITYPMPAQASGIHHITDADLEGAPSIALVVAEMHRRVLDANAIPVAHNAEYDRLRFAFHGSSLGSMPWICSERAAHHVDPDAPNFKLQTLRYHYGFYNIDLHGLAPHRAEADLYVTAPVFLHLIALYRAWAAETCGTDEARLEKAEQVETFMEYVRRPYVMTKFPNFGMHRNKPMAEIPMDYFEWCFSPRGLTDMEDDLRWNIQREMQRRRGATQSGLFEAAS